MLAADALRIAGLKEVSCATILPLATGMALTTVLLTLKRFRPPTARYVVWSRSAPFLLFLWKHCSLGVELLWQNDRMRSVKMNVS